MKNFQFSSVHNYDHPSSGANIRGEFGEFTIQALFVSLGYRVCPAFGYYPYDMIVERHSETFRVQVKTVISQPNVKPYPRSEFSHSLEFDLAAIMAGDGSIFVIPLEEMDFEHRESSFRFNLYPKYDKFCVGKFKGFERSEKLEFE